PAGRQLRGVVSDPAAELDRVVTQVRRDQTHQPAAVVAGAPEVLQDFRLQPAPAVLRCHARSPGSTPAPEVTSRAQPPGSKSTFGCVGGSNPPPLLPPPPLPPSSLSPSSSSRQSGL